jgi:hypothetical protein
VNGNKERPRVTAGLDLGDKYSHLCLLDTGEVMEEGLPCVPARKPSEDASLLSTFAHRNRNGNPLALG